MGKRSPEHGSTRWLGQHFLKSPKLAASLVKQIDVASLDLVVEVGAGHGILTEELTSLAAKVLAVELDPTLAISLVKRFSSSGNVVVVAGDFFDLPLPADPFRVFGNIPFGSTTRLLRHLLDPPVTGLVRADIVVQHGAAIKRTRRGNLLNLCWGPWWEFRMGPRIAARSFKPPPAVDAALLTIAKRDMPLVPVHEKLSFVRFLRAGFGRSEVRTAVRPFISARALQTLSTRMGFSLDARPPELDLRQWVTLYRACKNRRDHQGR